MEEKQITLQIDGHFITVPEGSTILEASCKIGINIPTLCHIDLKGNKWLKRNLGIQTLTLKGDIADLFRISTIKQERGTSYPFSRQFSFTLSAMF